MIAMSILSIMITMVFSVYFQITDTERKLAHARILSDTAREITERITTDITESWVETIPFDATNTYIPWTKYDSQNGSEYLSINNGTIYIYGAKTETGIKPCIDNYAWSVEKTKTDINIHCSLYLKKGSEYINLADFFIPEESKKRIKIQNLKFYISGQNKWGKKVTLKMQLSLMPRVWVSADMLQSGLLDIQTTISERSWRK